MRHPNAARHPVTAIRLVASVAAAPSGISLLSIRSGVGAGYKIAVCVILNVSQVPARPIPVFAEGVIMFRRTIATCGKQEHH